MIKRKKLAAFCIMAVVVMMISIHAFAKETTPMVVVTLERGCKNLLTNEKKFPLYADSKDEVEMLRNSEQLQAAVDYASEKGGGVVTIPVGDYYFKPLKSSKNFGKPDSVLKNTDANYIEYHIVECKDHVTIEGTLNADGTMGTTLFPVGQTSVPIDMFYFADLFETADKSNAKYLVNNHFRNFCIDGIHTYNYGYYNAKGKGFYFCLFKDCSWENVTVMNTDGTGFGMDCPVNSKIKNCTAIACGKQASVDSVGASGFGIGFGYSDDEGMIIENCTSIANRKYGVFFEHQARFSQLFRAETAEGFIVKNCVSRGNLYDFGGEMARNLTYIDCVSEELKKNDPNPFGSENKRAYYFGTKSKDYHIFENQKEISVWVANKKYYTDVHGWFVKEGWFDLVMDMGIMYGYTDSEGQPLCVFGQDDRLARAQIAVMLFRYCNPDYESKENVKNTTPFRDNVSGAFYTEAMNWAYKQGIFTGDKNPDGSLKGIVRPTDGISRQELAVVLFRFAKKKGANVVKYDRDAYKKAADAKTVAPWAAEAVSWCYANKILTGGSSAGAGLMPCAIATRGHAGKMIPQTLRVLEQ